MKRISLKQTLKTVLLMTLLVLLVGVNKYYAKAADGELTALTIKTGKEDISASSVTGQMGTNNQGTYSTKSRNLLFANVRL